MKRIMRALEALLAQKRFDRITMAELARRSGTGISSIYARFSDKHALILGMHGQVRDEVLDCLDASTDPVRWKGATIEAVVRDSIPAILRFYRRHESLLRAALFIDAEVVRDRQAAVLHHAASKYAALFATLYPRGGAPLDRAVDAAVRFVASIMYATIMFSGVRMVRSAVSDRELARQLALVVTALLGDALQGSAPGRAG